MNISIKLIQFEAGQYAICEATVEQEGRRVSVYGMAMAEEPGRIVELAQSRALQLAQQLIQQRPAALPVGDLPSPSAAIPASPEPAVTPLPEPLPSWFVEEAAPATPLGERLPDLAVQTDDALYPAEPDPPTDAPPSDMLPVEPALGEEPAGSAAADAADMDAVINIPW